MPPSTASSRRKAPRCAYVEADRRCSRKGDGNPPLCPVHRLVLEAEATRPLRPGERLVGLLGRVLRGQRVNDNQVFAGLDDLMGMFQSPGFDELRAQVEAQARARARAPRQPPRQPPLPPPGQPPPPRPPAGPDPRVVLGFGPGDKLTVAIVKARHRELARKHHPDRGGSVTRMQEVNAAVDKLLASL